MIVHGLNRLLPLKSLSKSESENAFVGLSHSIIGLNPSSSWMSASGRQGAQHLPWITDNAGDFTASIYIHFAPSQRISGDRKGEFPRDKHDSMDRKQMREGNQYRAEISSQWEPDNGSIKSQLPWIYSWTATIVRFSNAQREETTKNPLMIASQTGLYVVFIQRRNSV